MIAQMPGARFTLPLNVVTSFIGAPLVVWIVARQRSFGHV
jgi:iron complex transport system permease protein